MKICDAVQEGISVLGDSEISRLNCEVLLAHTLGRTREYVFVHSGDEILDGQFADFLALAKKNTQGCPVAYLVNEKEFYGLSFYVDPRVLIPRPETEMVVDAAVEVVSGAAPKEAKILDVGTGSGAIAVSLLKNLPGAECVACDISSDALDVAHLNAEKHGVLDRITFVQSDLLENIEGDFDIVCANLPYIGGCDFVDRNVKQFEPDLALFPGTDGLSLYKKLFQQLSGGQIKFNCLIGEFGFGQANSISELLNKYFDQNWEIREDLRGISRVFLVRV